ncbi:MAG: Omp28 family outer membrane lipoprotein [Ignavibacteria bacterium]|nr:Omp28 family outer membrane lipoprotein [Ignavibacteria bacterium]
MITPTPLLIFFLAMLCLMGCDEIQPPYLENPKNDDTTKYLQKILLEEYTGFRCGNCPEAAEVAHSLKEKYPNNVILLTVHSGPYAKPTATKTYDFRTTIGEELDNFFGCSKAGNPNGMVNRIGFPSKSHILREGQWESAIQNLLTNKPKLIINLTTNFEETNRKISATIVIKFLERSSPNYHLCLYIVEDSIVQYQRDDRKTPPDIDNYVHNNILRGGLTSTWGEKISDIPLEPQTTITKKYEYLIPSEKDWRPEKLRIIAFVHDKDSSFEILQVEESKLFNK